MAITDVVTPGTLLSSGAAVSDAIGQGLALPTPWRPIKVSGAEIQATVERLVNEPAPANGRRAAYLVHPESTGRSFAPGVDVAVEVLLPGEQTSPLRRNASLVEIGIAGTGSLAVDGSTIVLAEHDVTTIPSMRPHQFHNTGDQPWVRLAYSNAPLLELLGAHYYEEVDGDWNHDTRVEDASNSTASSDTNRRSAPDLEVSTTGARLRGYEFLVDIEPTGNRALHWPYAVISDLMSHAPRDGKRTIMALYNPATGNKQGATSSFFVTLSQIPSGVRPKREGRGHRHSSVAINYHFGGSGYSIVDGQRIDWEPGDLLLSAPSWREHAHYFSETGMSVYTVQDHPLHIGMESLIWQEDMEGPILALGLDPGQTGYVAPRNWDDD